MSAERKPVDVEALRAHAAKALVHLDTAADDCESGRASYALPKVKEAAWRLRQINGGLAAVAELVAAASHVECACSVRERDSGHRVGCFMPDLSAALDAVRGGAK